MSVRLRCPNGHPLRASQQYFGGKVPCPSCQVEVAVPNEPPEAVDNLLNWALNPTVTRAKPADVLSDRGNFVTARRTAY